MQTLRVGDQLSWTAAQNQTVLIRLQAIAQIKDSDGTSWYRVTGQAADGRNYTWFLDPTGDGDIALVLKQMRLKESGITKRDINQIENAEAGEVTFEGETYVYHPQAGDDAQLIESPNSAPEEVSYVSFVSKTNPDMALVVLEKNDMNIFYQTESFELADLTVLPR